MSMKDELDAVLALSEKFEPRECQPITDFELHAAAFLRAHGARLRAAVEDAEKLKAERDEGVAMLAGWCNAVSNNGTGWDDWDEYYKDAAYRPCLLREAIDAARASENKTP